MVDLASSGADPKAVAFYYPQFHRTALNDRLYGEGFTEWHNVRRGVPLFDGHHQPRVPAEDIGYYSLDDLSVYEKQVELARAAGLGGFCFYHYWMTGGRRILERPFEAVVQSDIDFPFCLMWANHDWTMAWRGEPDTLSLEMTYAVQDPADFIADIADALRDDRYIRIDGKPLLSIYEIDGPPDLSSLIEGLRAAARDQGIGELFIAGVQIRLDSPNRFCPDLDGLVEFPPHGYYLNTATDSPEGMLEGSAVQFHDYNVMAAKSVIGANLAPGLSYFRSATPDWDNTARRIENLNPIIFLGSTPERFGAWVRSLLHSASTASTASTAKAVLPVVFLNAWNEWGEGAYLEPDQLHGRAYLDALATATTTWSSAPSPIQVAAEFLVDRPDVLAELRPLAVAEFQAAAEAPPAGPEATVWIDQLQFGRAPFDEHMTVFRDVGRMRGLVANDTVRQTPDEVRTHTLYLCAENGECFAATLPASPRPDLIRDDGWLSAENVAAAGFEGWVDFRSVPVGSYELRIPLADRLGIFKTTIEVQDRNPSTPLPEFNLQRTKRKGRTLFEPGTDYGATFRPGSAHEKVSELVRESGARRVLDCGCADGSFGAHIASESVEVHGLEYDAIALARAKRTLASANRADFELSNWTSKAPGPFDALLFIDVLEHVRRPDAVLRQAKALVNPGGSVIASIPNVAHISMRVALLAGDWQYQDWGLLDRTHLRFFTLASIERMFVEAGYELARVERTSAPPGVLTTVPSELAASHAALGEDPEAQAYQYVVEAISLES